MSGKVVLSAVGMICVTLLIALYLHVSRPLVSTHYSPDTFTYCLQVTMSESRQSGKVIDIEKANEICSGLQKVK